MSRATTKTRLQANVPFGGTFTVPYPKGHSTASVYDDGTHRMWVGAGTGWVSYSTDTPKFRVRQTGGYLLITNLSALLLAGSEVTIDLEDTASANTPAGIPGNAVCLVGDSHTDLVESLYQLTSGVVYNSATGILTVTNSSHRLDTGWPAWIWSYSYPSLNFAERYTATRIDDNTHSFDLNEHFSPLPADLGSGTAVDINQGGAKALFIRYPHRRSNKNFLTPLLLLYGQMFTIAENYAQSGATSHLAASKLGRAKAAAANAFIGVLPHVNDRSVSNGPINVAESFANVRRLFRGLASTGKKVIALTTPPVASGEARATVQAMQQTAELNQLLVRELQSMGNVCVVDEYGAIIDSSSATGLATAAMLSSVDKIHTNAKGAFAAAILAGPKLQQFLPYEFDTRPKSAVDSFVNSQISVSSGTISAAGLVTLTLASNHTWLVGDPVGVKGADTGREGANGWFTILDVPAANKITYQGVASGIEYAALAGTVVASRGRNVFPNPVMNTAASGGSKLAAFDFNASGGAGGTSAQYVYVSTLTGSTTGSGYTTVTAHPDGYGNTSNLLLRKGVLDECYVFQNTGITSTMVGTTRRGVRMQLECELILSSHDWAVTPIEEFWVELLGRVKSTAALIAVKGAEFYDSGVSIGLSGTTTYKLYCKTPVMDLTVDQLDQLYFNVGVRCAANFDVTADGTNLQGLKMQLGRVACNVLP